MILSRFFIAVVIVIILLIIACVHLEGFAGKLGRHLVSNQDGYVEVLRQFPVLRWQLGHAPPWRCKQNPTSR